MVSLLQITVAMVWLMAGAGCAASGPQALPHETNQAGRSLHEQETRKSEQQLREYKQLLERVLTLELRVRETQEDLARRERERHETIEELKAIKRPDRRTPSSESAEKRRRMKELAQELRELVDTL